MKYLTPGERIVLATRPSAWFVLLHARAMPVFAIMLALIGAGWSRFGLGMLDAGGLLVRIALVIMLLHLAIGVVRWLSRLYVLTERRVIVVAGVFAQQAGDVPLARVQHVVVDRTFVERLLLLGTVGVATAGGGSGGDGTIIRWLTVAKPDRIMTTIRSMTDGARQPLDDSGRPGRGEAGARTSRARIVVIGLAGGIGAGKSRVAKCFADLGCVVIDSDRQAREALERPEVRQALLAWWGPEVLAPASPGSPGDDRPLDRGKIARIIFSDPMERARLEGLVHPIIRARRGDLLERASAAGAPAAVIDAPLLFEAGVDAECDVVVWVEASRETRLERVIKNRGWDEAELARREEAQWPLERKRALCRYTIVNDARGGGSKDRKASVAEAVRSLLDEILTSKDRSAGT
ncbi:dephospho-CoA kinase [Nodularia spumigena]|uniref:dephospho-CoA kinase n=1 Tax=Nodularia spumigena TaxID=70799 RepID=UPI002B1EF585|nr:dephospho-CoA kinase [Nodularia spumigena]MEA5557612.1 dephospho-CoA kinase [Nodularia spumigena CH309]